MEEFSAGVCEKLKFYVYRLIDPRNGNTFYVGKGKDNRVFAHAKAALDYSEDEDAEATKMSTIREILATGLEVAYVIHRHGMDEQTALEVEAALIDAYPSYNINSGYGADRGSMSPSQIEKLYGANEISSFPDKCLIIKIKAETIEANNGNIYEAVRKAWRANKARAEQADYILASKSGLVVGVYVAEQWLVDEASGRIYFEGSEAGAGAKSRYLNHRLPDKFMRTPNGGAVQAPVLYTY